MIDPNPAGVSVSLPRVPAPFWGRGAAPTTSVAARSVSATAAVGGAGPGNSWTHLEKSLRGARALLEPRDLGSVKVWLRMSATAGAPPVCNTAPQVKIKKLFPNLTYFLSKTLSK